MRVWEFQLFYDLRLLFFFRCSKESAVFWSLLFSPTFMSVPLQTAYFRSRYLSVYSMSNVWKTFKSHPTSFSPSHLPRSEIKAPRCCGSVCVCLCGHCWQKPKLRGGKKIQSKKETEMVWNTQCLEMTLGILLRKHMEFGEESVFKWRPLKSAYFVYGR